MRPDDSTRRSPTEALARVLDPAESFTDTDGEMSLRIFSGKRLAERILADPGPLLEALTEAGVLEKMRSFQDGYRAAERHYRRKVAELKAENLRLRTGLGGVK